MDGYFKVHSMVRSRERGSDLILYSIPMLSKNQFYEIIQEFTKAGSKVSILKVGLKTKLTSAKAREWLLNDNEDLPPHSVVIHCSGQTNYVKIYSNGIIFSTFEIEPLIINFLKAMPYHERILRGFPTKLPENFENNYFKCSSHKGYLDIFLKTRFECPKSIWLANRSENKLCLLDDELLVLKTLAKLIMPSYIEANFNFLAIKDVFGSIVKPSIRPIFRGKISTETFIEQIDALLERPFPRNLRGLKSFIIPEDSKFIFHEPKVKVEGKHLKYLFKVLKTHCYDSYHVTNTSI